VSFRTEPAASASWLATVIIVSSAGGVLMGSEYWWLFLVIGTAGLFIAAWNVFGVPTFRRWRLRRPVQAHFTNRNSKRTYSGRNVSRSDPHFIRRITLPSGQESLIEIGYFPRVKFHLNEMAVSINGEFSVRPRILERTDQYVQSGARPSTIKDYIAGDAYHAFINSDRNVGTHFVIGVKVKTKMARPFSSPAGVCH
jgi:hypothetical protein